MKVFNREKIIKGLESGKYNFKNGSKALRDDEQIALIAAKHHRGDILRNASARLQNSDHFVKEILSIDGREIASALPKYRKEEEYVLLALKSSPSSFESLLPKFKEDRDFILKASKINGFILQDVDEKFLEDNEIVTSALKTSPFVYKFIQEKFEDDVEIAKLAVSGEGYNYKFCSQNMKENEEVALLAMQNANGYAGYLYERCMPDTVRQNLDITLIACHDSINSIKFIPPGIFFDKVFMNQIIKQFRQDKEEILQNCGEEEAMKFEQNVRGLMKERETELVHERIYDKFKKIQEHENPDQALIDAQDALSSTINLREQIKPFVQENEEDLQISFEDLNLEE